MHSSVASGHEATGGPRRARRCIGHGETHDTGASDEWPAFLTPVPKPALYTDGEVLPGLMVPSYRGLRTIL